jgi:hypothetical protein
MIGLDHTLRDPVMIPEINENEMAVVPDAVHPAG